MKKTLLLATLISSYSFAQTVIMDQSNEPAIGDLKTMYTCDSLTDPLEATTGNGVTWDYTQLVGINGTRNLIVIDPATSPYSSIYTNSTKGYSIEGSLTNFYNSTSTERQSQGFIFEEPSFGTVIAHFDVNEQKTVSYPFANGDSFTDNFSGNLSFTFNGLAQNPSCTGRSYASIDGQGTLLLPSSTTIENVIRYKIVDTVFTQVSFVIPLDVVFIRTQYEYYDLTNDNMPVFTYSFVSIKQANSATPLATQTAVLSSVQPILTAGLDTKKEINFAVYPNPSEGKITIAGNLNNSSAIITDMRGRAIKVAKNISTGQQIDLTDLQRGSYFITIETDGKRTTQKLILQ
jgi:hypothetical protein